MNNTKYIFVDDNSPEASDYDNYYIGYEPDVAGSYDLALEEAKRQRACDSAPASRSSVCSRENAAADKCRRTIRAPAIKPKVSPFSSACPGTSTPSYPATRNATRRVTASCARSFRRWWTCSSSAATWNAGSRASDAITASRQSPSPDEPSGFQLE
jgi:hypothetical protein